MYRSVKVLLNNRGKSSLRLLILTMAIKQTENILAAGMVGGV